MLSRHTKCLLLASVSLVSACVSDKVQVVDAVSLEAIPDAFVLSNEMNMMPVLFHPREELYLTDCQGKVTIRQNHLYHLRIGKEGYWPVFVSGNVARPQWPDELNASSFIVTNGMKTVFLTQEDVPYFEVKKGTLLRRLPSERTGHVSEEDWMRWTNYVHDMNAKIDQAWKEKLSSGSNTQRRDSIQRYEGK